MTLAMLVIIFKTNKLLFLMIFIVAGLALWGLGILVNKLLDNNGEG